MAGIGSLSQMLKSYEENRRLQKRNSRFSRSNRIERLTNPKSIEERKRESIVEKERWENIRRSAMRRVARQYLMVTLALTGVVSVVVLLLK